MSYAQQQGNPVNRISGVAVVVLLHAVLIYALVNGLARKVVDVVKGPLETKIIQEVKPPPPDATPPPPPKFAPPPPTFIPPPEVNIAEAPASQATITAVTAQKPVEAPPPAAAAPAVVVHKEPVVKAKSCSEPEYPAGSERMGEAGKVVLALLIGVDGHVVESKIETSSGYPRLDQAAKDALSLCKFEPGTANGKPEEAWGKLAYVFRNPAD